MLSARLVELIESNWKELASRFIVAIRANPETTNLAQRSDLELREWCQSILENIGYYLSGTRHEEIDRRFRIRGRVRFEEEVPLHETILRYQMLHEKILGFVREQGYPMTAMELYAEEELERALRRFFYRVMHAIVLGYEDQLRRTYAPKTLTA